MRYPNKEDKVKKFVLVLSVVVISVALVGSTLPGYAQKELTILRARHFVEAWEETWSKIVEDFEASHPGVKVRTDFVAKAEQEMKQAAEAEARKGHDIISFRVDGPALYGNALANVDDVIAQIAAESGDPTAVAKEYGITGGEWKGVPIEFFPSQITYRMDYWQQAGYGKDQIWNLTYEELLEPAAKLQTLGHPVSMAFSQITGDTHHWMIPVLWAYGSHLADKNLNVTIDSANTYAALDYAKKLYQYMTPGVLAWEGGSDNRFMLSGIGGACVNSGSIYLQARRENLPHWKQINHAPLPSGPAGRFVEGFIVVHGVWEFGENKDLAKEFLVFLFKKENALAFAEAGLPASLSPWTGITPAFDNPAFEAFAPIQGQIHHTPDWPAPVTAAGIKAWTQAIVPIMFGKVAIGMPIQEAIDWAEKELKELY